MAELVAIDLPGGPEFVRALGDAWDAGNAVAPIDRRLAPAARERLLEILRPARVLTPRGTRERADSLPVEAGDALVMATSGSAGEPRGVVLTHAAVAASAHATSARLGVDPARHRWLACLPLNHIGGLSVITRSLITGTPLTVLPGFDEIAVIAASGPQVLASLVPTALNRIDPGSFYKVLLGGSAAPPGLPGNVVTTYGMTETGSGVVYDGVPLDGVEVSVVSGEILLRCPMLLRAYRDGTVPLDENGWFATGDAGELGDQGRLSVKGRLAEMIITGGENVWPAIVEDLLRGHDGVQDVAVSGMPDPDWGQRVVAFVVPADRQCPPTLAELRTIVRDNLAAFAAPRELVLVESLPKTAIGKLRREALRTMATGAGEIPTGATSEL